jgi:streptogramin lyase
LKINYNSNIMKNILLITALLIFEGNINFAQIGVNASNTPPNTSAMLDVSSTTKGVLIPRMTTAQKNAIPSKSESLMVYDTDVKQFSYWTGTTWVNFGNSVSAGVGWSQSGNNISNTNTGNVGIGTSAPKAKLEVNSGVSNSSGLRMSQIKAKPIETKKYYTINTPTSLAFDNDNNLYVTSNIENKIYSISKTGRKSDFITTGLNLPFGIAIGPDNNIYVSNAGDNNILKITPNKEVTVFASGFNFPVGLTFDLSGNLYVVNSGGTTLSKISAAGVVNLNFGTGLNSAEGCVFNPISNKIYVANVGASEIAQFDAITGGAKTTFIAGNPYLNDITCDYLGNLYFSETANNKIIKVNNLGVKTDFATSQAPSSLVFDKNKKLTAAAYSLNQISKQSINTKTILSVNELGDIIPIESTSIVDEHYIGERFGGGIIFFLSEDKKNGLIVSTRNQFSTIVTKPLEEVAAGEWIHSFGHVSNPNNYDGDAKNYRDWRLPSNSELIILGRSRVLEQTLENLNRFWSTTPHPNDNLYICAVELADYYDCSSESLCLFYQLKTRRFNTRAVRAF